METKLPSIHEDVISAFIPLLLLVLTISQQEAKTITVEIPC